MGEAVLSSESSCCNVVPVMAAIVSTNFWLCEIQNELSSNQPRASDANRQESSNKPQQAKKWPGLEISIRIRIDGEVSVIVWKSAAVFPRWPRSRQRAGATQ